MKTSGVLYIDNIKDIIPHRYPFLMIDRVEEMVLGKSCVAYKNVTNNEWEFEGHFPGRSIMPGVLIIEAMAQGAGVLAFSTLFSENVCKPGDSEIVYFTSIENARFKRPVVPGDILRIEISISQRRGNKFWRFNALAFVGNDLADEANFRAMIPED
ncbi:MAG: 3-hydroxyacyl-ACP dehydratase FabZ [Holosporales bacterium]|nr:3-hydroxyacyl-ACP dehydratase FabZ [Holosporales bacterium]